MEYSKELLNDVLVQLFNQILFNEEYYLKKRVPANLTLNNIHVLEAVDSFKNYCSMSELANKLNITSSTLSTNIKKLIKEKYLIKLQSNQDKRVYYIKLTAKGKKIVKIHDEYHKQMVDIIIANLGNKETANLIDLLSKIKYFFNI